MTRPGTTSIATRFLVALLDEAGRAPDDLLAAAGVARAELDSPDLMFPLDAFRELWARSAALQPDIGVAMIERFPPGQMHMLAHLALRAPTVAAALEDGCRHARVTSAADVLSLVRDGPIARLQYAPRAGAANPWMAEHYFSMTIVLLARATGRALPVRRVEFIAAGGAPLAAYESRFGVTPQFDATRNALEFDADALDWPLLTQDGYLHAILERVAEAREQPAEPDSVLETARREIAKRVLQGATPSIDEIARSCGLGARALRARLAQDGSGFRALLDDVRRDLAREHLGRGLSVTEAAYLLGFSEPAAFQHACRRWFGEAAGAIRAPRSSR